MCAGQHAWICGGEEGQRGLQACHQVMGVRAHIHGHTQDVTLGIHDDGSRFAVGATVSQNAGCATVFLLELAAQQDFSSGLCANMNTDC